MVKVQVVIVPCTRPCFGVRQAMGLAVDLFSDFVAFFFVHGARLPVVSPIGLLVSNDAARPSSNLVGRSSHLPPNVARGRGCDARAKPLDF
jgi:hypothetical protein